MRKNIVLLLLCFLLSAFVFAGDFGLVLDQNADYGGFEGDGSFTWSGILIPRFSAMIGNNSNIYVSAGLQAAYDEEWFFVPELLRTEFSMYSGMFDFTIGRMQYSEPLGFIAEGLFDGASVSMTNDYGTFGLGAWYTGFLYKRRAKIAMTQEELLSYSKAFEYGDFANTYFAPGHLVGALGWEHLGNAFKKKVSFLAQADLAGEELLHSQYLIGKLSFPFSVFSFDAGVSFELIQDRGDFGIAMAAELGVIYPLPIRLPGVVSFLARYSSGENGPFTAFEPVNTKAQGEILNAKLSGLSLLSLDCFVRPHKTFSCGITSTYFIRSDLETYLSYPVLKETNEGNFLGNEFFARFLWSPVSDIQANLGGGLFLPSMGNVSPDAGISWRVELNVIISLF